MLKIKENIDLKELEKFGFEKDGECYYCDLRPYKKTNYSYITIENRKINSSYVEADDIEKTLNILFDLIQAGLVEKVEE